MTHLVHGGDFGTVPPFYADICGAAKAGVPWLEFASYPLAAKNMIFAAMTAENLARSQLQDKQ